MNICYLVRLVEPVYGILMTKPKQLMLFQASRLPWSLYSTGSTGFTMEFGSELLPADTDVDTRSQIAETGEQANTSHVPKDSVKS